MRGGKTFSGAGRDELPALGFRNYWYPALRACRVTKRPVPLRLLGEDLVIFRDWRTGRLHALSDRCAHRGGRLSLGRCHFPGTVTCPYHGLTYDGTGQCVAALSEGPDSTLPRTLRIPAYPAEERQGIVWTWMGDGEAVPLEEDLPEEFLQPDVAVFTHVEEWRCNWRLAIENSADGPAHAMYLHRTSPRALLYKLPAFGRVTVRETDDGKGIRVSLVPGGLQGEFAGLGRYPRRVWWRVLSYRPAIPQGFEVRLPGYLRAGFRAPFYIPWGGLLRYVHWSVPVDEGRSRHFLFWLVRGSMLKAVLFGALYYPVVRYFFDKLFVGQDRTVCETQVAGLERLSINDVSVIQWRRLAARARRTSPVSRAAEVEAQPVGDSQAAERTVR